MLISALISKAVWARSQQRGAALLLLLALASYANRQGWAWPKLTTLARRARMSRRYVTSLLRLLAQAGEIEIDPLPADRRRSRYRLVAFVTERNDSEPQRQSEPARRPPPRSYLPDDPLRAEWQAIARRREPQPFRIQQRLEQLAAQLPVDLPQRSRWQNRLRHLDGELEYIQAELARIEQALLKQLSSRLSRSQLAQLNAQVAAELQPHQQRLSADELQHQRRRLLQERLRERFRVPRLSLFTFELSDRSGP